MPQSENPIPIPIYIYIILYIYYPLYNIHIYVHIIHSDKMTFLRKVTLMQNQKKLLFLSMVS